MPQRVIEKLSVLVYPRYDEVKSTKAYDAKWMRAAREASYDPKHAMVVILPGDLEKAFSRGPRDIELAKKAKAMLEGRLVMLSNTSMRHLAALGKIFAKRGLSVSRDAKVVGMGQHYSNTPASRYCIELVGSMVRNGMWIRGELSIDKKRSIRSPLDLLYSEISKTRPWLRRSPEEMGQLQVALRRAVPMLNHGLLKYGEVIRLAKKIPTGQLEKALDGAVEQRIRNIASGSGKIPNQVLDDLLMVAAKRGYSAVWRDLIEEKKHRAERGTYRLPEHGRRRAF